MKLQPGIPRRYQVAHWLIVGSASIFKKSVGSLQLNLFKL